jgi:hypothetical protein
MLIAVAGAQRDCQITPPSLNERVGILEWGENRCMVVKLRIGCGKPYLSKGIATRFEVADTECSTAIP